METGAANVKGRHQKLVLRGPRKRLLELEVDVRVEPSGSCSVLVFAAYWIINRTHEQAIVRIAPS